MTDYSKLPMDELLRYQGRVDRYSQTWNEIEAELKIRNEAKSHWTVAVRVATFAAIFGALSALAVVYNVFFK